MRCLDAEQCSDWLRSAGIVERPYELAKYPPGIIGAQFNLPTTASGLAAFLRCLTPVLGSSGSVLMQVTDTEMPEEEDLALMGCIRLSAGEQRPVMEAPGHLFAGDELNLFRAVFALTINFKWEAYAYFEETRDVLLNWEGDLMDWWCWDARRLEEGRTFLRGFNLKET